MKKIIMAGFLAGFIGGLCGSFLLTSKAVEAARDQAAYRELSLYNTSNKRVGLFGPGRVGQGALWVFDSGGKPLIQMGSYEASHEKG